MEVDAARLVAPPEITDVEHDWRIWGECAALGEFASCARPTMSVTSRSTVALAAGNVRTCCPLRMIVISSLSASTSSRKCDT